VQVVSPDRIPEDPGEHRLSSDGNVARAERTHRWMGRSVNANPSRAGTAVTIERPPRRGTLRRVCASGEETSGGDLRGVVAGDRNLANPKAGCRAQQTCSAPNDPKGSAAEETVEAGRNGEGGRARCGNPSIARASARARADAAARRTAEGRDGSRGERTNRRVSPEEIEITPPVIAIPSGNRPRSRCRSRAPSSEPPREPSPSIGTKQNPRRKTGVLVFQALGTPGRGLRTTSYVSAGLGAFDDQPPIHPAAAWLPSSASWIASACAPA